MVKKNLLSLFGIEFRTEGLHKIFAYRYRESLFNPNNLAVNLLALNKSSNYYFSQYLSFKAEFLTGLWQIDLLGTSVYRGHWNHDLRAQQFYFQRDLFRNWVLMAGRAILRWGTGYGFNPTDVVAPEKELSDLDNKEKRAVGNDILKLEYFGESYSIALCYLTHLQFDSRFKAEGLKFAFRFYKNLWDIDLSFIFLLNKDESPIGGINFSYVVGNRLEIHGETSVQRGSYRLYHKVLRDKNQLFQDYPLANFKRNYRKLYQQYMLGLQYTFAPNILWIVEFYHQDQGYSQEEWRKIVDYIKFLNIQLNTPGNQMSEYNLLWSLNVFSPKGAMKDYLMNYLNVPISDNIDLKSTWLLNLSDFSFVIIPELNLTIENTFTFYTKSTIFYGNKETEFDELFYSILIEGGIRFRI